MQIVVETVTALLDRVFNEQMAKTQVVISSTILRMVYILMDDEQPLCIENIGRKIQ